MKQIIVLFWILFFVSCTPNHKERPAARKASPYIKSLFTAVEINPKDIISGMKLVHALDSAEYYPEALEQLSTLIKLDSLNYGFWFTKGKIEQNKKDTAAAIQAYLQAASLYPAPEALLAVANLYAEKANTNVFIVCKQLDAMGLEKTYQSYTNFFRGVYYDRAKQPQKAIPFFEKSIVDNYTFMDAYIELGSIYYAQNELPKALETFALANEINNAYADAYYWQGKTYEKMNNKVQAYNFYEKALFLDNTITEAEAGIERTKN